MALTDEQRGPRAAWLARHRKARFGQGEAGLAALAEALRERGAYRAPDTIKGWESGDERAPIPPDIVPHLEAIFGEPAPVPKRPVTPEEVVAALAAQTAAINALVARLDLFVGPLGEAVAEMLRAQTAAAIDRPGSGAASGSGRQRSATSQ